MFLDYYAILEVDESASFQEIKTAFKKQAVKWHPDKNIPLDTTQQMQEINEAYLLLKDTEAKARYDSQYAHFKKFKQAQQEPKHHETRQTYTYKDYQSSDDVLNNWMRNAQKQAVDLAKQSIQDFKGIASVGMKAAVKEAGNQFIIQVIVGIIFFIIIVLSNSCNH
jgi:DnaJ-class molecular chaperone